MTSLRSQETLQKEQELQGIETTNINLLLQHHSDKEAFYAKLTDIALFANEMRTKVPEGTIVIQDSRPAVRFVSEGENYSTEIVATPNCWWFEINGTTTPDLTKSQLVGPGRALKEVWGLLIPSLPENFIIRGIVIKGYNGFDSRMQILSSLGFSDHQANGEVYGIVKNGELKPLTLDEFLALTGTTPAMLDESFSVKQINWPGA